MRGFQPATQNYADGGMVSRIKGALGFGPKDDKKKAQAPSPAPAPAPTPSPAPAPAKEPGSAIGQYAGGSALKRRMAEIDSYANGGPVRGPGTGTSDEVPDTVAEGTYIMPTDSTEAIGEQNLAAMGKGAPVDVNLSNGEFKLPPDQVHAIGVQALDQMKDATHTPVAARGFAPGAQQEAEPPLFFVNGGVVDEEARKKPISPTNIYPQGSPYAGANVNGKAAQDIRDGAAAAGNFVASAFPGTTAAVKGAMEDTRQAYSQSGFGGALGTAARTAATPIIGMADDVMGGAARVIDPAAQALKTFVTGDATPIGQQPSAAAPPVAAKPAASPAAASAAPSVAAAAASDAGAGTGSGSINPPVVNPAATAPTSSQPQAAQVSPGVFRSGNSYSDSAAGAIGGLQTRGLPSAQNMAAADALAQRSQADSTARLMSGQPVERGWSGVIGSDPGMSAAGRERRDLVASLTTPLKGAQNGQLTAAQRNGMLSLLDQEARGFQAKANNATDLQRAEMQTNAQREMAAMREAGDNSRAVLREAGETGRAGARNAIDQGRLGLEQQVRGFDIRAGQRQEKLYEKYDAAKTPEEKSAIVQQIRDLSGKQTESPWKIQVTPATKNVDGSTSEGSIYRYNGQTGAVERVDTSKPQLPLDQNPQAAAIKANTALTREQRAAELRKLGY